MLKNRIEKIKQELNISNFYWVSGISLVLYSVLFGFCCFAFIKTYLDHEPISKIIVLLVWGFATLSWVIVEWNKLIADKPEKKIDDLSKNKVFSQKWWSQNFPAIVVIVVLFIPILVIFIIAFSSDDLNNTYVISDPNFRVTEDFLNILIGLLFFSEALEKIIDFKQKLIKQIWGVLKPIILISVIITSIIYISHLTEVTP